MSLPLQGQPWLSVVMPIHGGATYLGATLASVAAEAPQGVEFLCYDSGADGGQARAIAEAHADQLAIRWADVPDIRPWTAKVNLGVGHASAPHIAILHQDDLWLPGHLAALRASLALAGDAVLSVGPSRLVGPAGQDVGLWRLPLRQGRQQGGDVATRLLTQNTIAVPAPLFRRDAFLAAGGMDDALWYTADWDLWLKLARRGDVFVRAGATTAFRLHGGSLTMTGSRDLADFRQQMERVLDAHAPQLAPPAAALARARASVALNVALAGVSAGDRSALMGALGQVARLGPLGAWRFCQETQIIGRLWPRVKLMLAGKL